MGQVRIGRRLGQGANHLTIALANVASAAARFIRADDVTLARLFHVDFQFLVQTIII